MKVGVPKEVKSGEARVGLTPGAAEEYVARGHRVIVETQAGAGIGASDADYLAAVDRGLEAIASHGGSVVVVSLGFDTYGQDPIGAFALTTAVYHEVGARVAALGRRLVVLQEGGYYRPALGENARAWLRGAEGRPHDPRPAG